MSQADILRVLQDNPTEWISTKVLENISKTVSVNKCINILVKREEIIGQKVFDGQRHTWLVKYNPNFKDIDEV
jgi:hypothetical protein